ncbi:type II secretion system protein J [Chloroflexota bacterium]
MTQKGFTLVEILLALAVGSVLMSAAVLTIYQVLVGTERNNAKAVVATEIQRSVFQIKKDIQSHTSANVSDLQVGPTTFEWTDQSGWTAANESQQSRIYSLSGKELIRNADGTTRILSRNIESLIFSDNGTHINVVITANNSTLPGRDKTLSFGVSKRTNYEAQ